MTRRLGYAIVLGFVVTLTLIAQTTAPIDKAFELFRAQKYEDAGTAFTILVTAEPGNGRAWYGLALVLHAQQQYERAISSFDKADRLGFNRAGVAFLKARSYAKAGNTAKALESLNKAIDLDFGNLSLLENDNDLAELRSDTRFKAVLTRFQEAARPCHTKPEYRQFDFFIGNWEQRTQSGVTVGAATVKLILENCVLEENTVNPQSNYEARAFHYYDPTLGKWRQTYVDTKAGVSVWIGEYADGVMRYTGEISHRSGSKTLGRNTFTRIDNDRVRQVFETSSDGGRTWLVIWDGFFVRKQTVK